jgi:mono/diheme cytochrome c family protein
VKILTKGKNEDMKSFKEKLTTEQMADVAKYVHSLGQKAKP